MRRRLRWPCSRVSRPPWAGPTTSRNGAQARWCARAEAARRLYRGQLPDAADWLQALSVPYVVWRSEDSAAYGGDALARLRAQLHGRYVWVPMDSGAPLAAGVFVRATERRSSGRQEPH